jgi:hypothetical protein
MAFSLQYRKARSKEYFDVLVFVPATHNVPGIGLDNDAVVVVAAQVGTMNCYLASLQKTELHALLGA